LDHKTDIQPRECAYLRFIFLAFLAVVLLVTAWVCDDAYISFRVSRNLVEGHGLTYNPGERVQAFTNPLWTLLMALAYSLTRDVYFTSILLSMVLTIGGVALLTFGLACSWREATLCALVLGVSKAFVDFSTSGLENPLTNFLLVLFVWVLLRLPDSKRKLFWLSLLTSLGAVNRLDTVLLFLPPLVCVFLTSKQSPRFRAVAVGSLPIVAWELFAVIYYGFWAPNTAYAKLNNGIPAFELIRQGAFYLADSLLVDPVTLTVIALGMAAPIILKRKDLLPLSIGLLLYGLYVLKIGGDFMSGRFFNTPVLLGAVILTEAKTARTTQAWICHLALILLLVLMPNYLVPHRTSDSEKKPAIHASGITDERAYYYDGTGLLRNGKELSAPDNVYVGEGYSVKESGLATHWVHCLGFVGFYAGPDVRVYDGAGLSDPVVARIPPMRTGNWRIGHFWRKLPEGYAQTVDTGINQIQEPSIANLYDRMKIITMGSLFRRVRFVEIWRMNTGFYSRFMDLEWYRQPLPETFGISFYNDYRHEQSWRWRRFFSEEGTRLLLKKPSHASLVRIHVDLRADFEVTLLNGNRHLGTVPVSKGAPIDGRLAAGQVDVPREIADEGFDALIILPIRGNGAYCIGKVEILDET